MSFENQFQKNIQLGPESEASYSPKNTDNSHQFESSFEEESKKQNSPNIDLERVRQKEEYIALGIELSKNPEGFPFPGILRGSYLRIKSEEQEYPGFATPIDQLLERFNNEGMKVVMSDDPSSGNIFILPKGSNDVENDNLFPRHLEITSDMNEKLKILIRLQTIVFGGK